MNQETNLSALPDDALVTFENGVKQMVPVSKSNWMYGCKTGRYPAPTKIGPRLNAWRMGTLRQFCRGEWQPSNTEAA
ncbi:MAG: hypothetical protein K9L32_00355 [Chromatiaceae bacterium]|nr:hypothetical protein [Chromatiaceae bacterium]MCF8002656.1 hypothetical protein [Chromatiaceae bacterium]